MDRASFYISVSDRSKVSPVIYQYIVDHGEGHTPDTIRDKVRETFAQERLAVMPEVSAYLNGEKRPIQPAGRRSPGGGAW